MQAGLGSLVRLTQRGTEGEGKREGWHIAAGVSTLLEYRLGGPSWGFIFGETPF